MPDIPDDIAHQLRKMRGGIVPPGGQGGRALVKNSADDYDYSWGPLVVTDDGGSGAVGTFEPISALPDAGPMDGSEEVPMVQAGVTVKGTTGDIAGLSHAQRDFYEQISPPATSCPNNTPTGLNWPTLLLGDTLLEFSTPTVPTVLADGVYTFDVAVATAGGTDFAVYVAVIEADTSYAAQSGVGIGVGAIVFNGATYANCTITAPLHAGAAVTVVAQQGSGGSVNIDISSVAVTRRP